MEKTFWESVHELAEMSRGIPDERRRMAGLGSTPRGEEIVVGAGFSGLPLERITSCGLTLWSETEGEGRGRALSQDEYRAVSAVCNAWRRIYRRACLAHHASVDDMKEILFDELASV